MHGTKSIKTEVHQIEGRTFQAESEGQDPEPKNYIYIMCLVLCIYTQYYIIQYIIYIISYYIILYYISIIHVISGPDIYFYACYPPSLPFLLLILASFFPPSFLNSIHQILDKHIMFGRHICCHSGCSKVILKRHIINKQITK